LALPLNCPLCESNNENQSVETKHVYGDTEKKHAFFHCLNCDVRYLFPRLTFEDESKFYASEFEAFMSSRSGVHGGWDNAEKHISVNEDNRIRRMNYIQPKLKENTTILEVGCSSGFMLFPLINQGHFCTGVEPSGVFQEYLTYRGIENYPNLENIPENKKEEGFDIIMHFFVLEHISNPVDFLKSQLYLLKPNGKIIFEIPSIADPLHSIFDIPAFERFYWSIAHPWYFNENSLEFLMKQIGEPFEIIRDQRYDLSNHMVWARDGIPGGMGCFSEKLGNEIEILYRQNLIQKGYCDTLIGILSKDEI